LTWLSDLYGIQALFFSVFCIACTWTYTSSSLSLFYLHCFPPLNHLIDRECKVKLLLTRPSCSTTKCCMQDVDHNVRVKKRRKRKEGSVTWWLMCHIHLYYIVCQKHYRENNFDGIKDRIPGFIVQEVKRINLSGQLNYIFVFR